MEERMDNNDMVDEIIAKLEDLFEEKGYTLEALQKATNHTGELKVVVDRVKDEIKQANPGISHEELIELASEKIAEMVQEQEMNQTKEQQGEDR